MEAEEKKEEVSGKRNIILRNDLESRASNCITEERKRGLFRDEIV